MSTFVCTLEEFRRVVAEFTKAAPTADEQALENGIKCVNLHYFGIEPVPAPGSVEEIMAVNLLEFANKRELQRTAELMAEARV